jgi:hypothetical protein
MRLELGLTGWFTDHDYDIYARSSPTLLDEDSLEISFPRFK